MKSRKSTVFIVELFILFIILLVVIVTITMLTMKTRDQSISAGRLTGAVILAENTAEMTSEAAGIKESAAMIGKMDDTQKPVVKGNVIRARAQSGAGGQSEGEYIIKVTVSEKKGVTGKYISRKIEIYSAEDNEKIYDLDTGEFFGRDAV